MTDIRETLDRIHQLDQDATDGPWTATNNNRVYEPSGYPLPGCFNCGENDGIYVGVDHELIAVYRNTTPKLANALRDVLDVICVYPIPSRQDDPTGQQSAAIEAFEQTIRQAIHDALGADHG